METIINTYRSTSTKTEYYPSYFTRDCIKENGDYKIYHAGINHFVYTYKGYAFNELAGLNLEHFENVVNRSAPKVENQMYWLYIRAAEALRKIDKLIKP